MADNKNNKGVNKSSIGVSKQTKPKAGDGVADLLAKDLNLQNLKAEKENKKAKDDKKKGSPGAKPKMEPEYDPYHHREKSPDPHGYYYTIGPTGKPVRRRLRTGSGYEQADVDKQKGFSQLVTERMLQGQGVKGSIKGGAKDLFSANMTSLKKLKDPMFYLNKLPGIGKMAAAAYGMKTGRAREDITYHTGVHAPAGMEDEDNAPGEPGQVPGQTATKVAKAKPTSSRAGGKVAAFPKVVARHIAKMAKDISTMSKDIKSLLMQGKGKNSPATFLEKIYNSLEKTKEKETKEKEISKELEDSKEQKIEKSLEVTKETAKSEKTENTTKKSMFEKLKDLRKPKTPKVSGIGFPGGASAGAAGLAGAAEGAEGLAAGAEGIGALAAGGSMLAAAAPWLLGAAAVGGVGYLGYKAMTDDAGPDLTGGAGLQKMANPQISDGAATPDYQTAISGINKPSTTNTTSDTTNNTSSATNISNLQKMANPQVTAAATPSYQSAITNANKSSASNVNHTTNMASQPAVTPAAATTPASVPTLHPVQSPNLLAARATAATVENKNLVGPSSSSTNAPIIVNSPTVNNVGGKSGGSSTPQGPTPVRNDEPVLTRVQYQNVRPV